MQEETAFRELYEIYKELVYNLALHYVRLPEDADDLTQEVFVKLYRHRQQHDPALASMKTWISRITINHCLDFIRRKKARKRFGVITSLFSREKENETGFADLQHPGIIAEDREELGALLDLINSLPEKQRTALILMKIEDFSQKEAAEIMNTSPKAVESLLQRAKQQLEKKWVDRKGFH